MNINLLAQGLVADIMQATQTLLPGEPGQEGADFEEMLLKQSQAAKPQQTSRPKDKTPAKEEPGKPQNTGTKDQEIGEEGQEVAAALVTSQPVVPIELVAAVEPVLVGKLEAPTLEQPVAPTAAWPAGAPTEEVPMAQPQAAETAVQPQAQPAAQSFQAQPQAQPEEGQAETIALPESSPEVAVQPESRTETAPVSRHQANLSEKEQPEEVQVTDTWTQEQQVFQRETAAPIKVADNYEEAEPTDLRLLDQVQNQISRAVQEGQSLVSLGQVMVEITRSADGTLSIMMSAATEKTATLLQRHGGILQQFLADNLQGPVQVTVQQPEQPENANQFLNPDGQNRQHQNQQHQEKKQKGTTEDFLQQLRLGLVGLEET